MQALVINLTTTVRRYSIVVEADKRRQSALNEWKAAAEACLLDRNSFTEAWLITSAEALKQANLDYYSLTRTAFPQGGA